MSMPAESFSIKAEDLRFASALRLWDATERRGKFNTQPSVITAVEFCRDMEFRSREIFTIAQHLLPRTLRIAEHSKTSSGDTTEG
jgi:hypothetical protein